MAAALVGVVGAVALWVGAGAPWWAPAVVLAGAVAGRLLALLLVPVRRYRAWAGPVGAAAALGWLAATQLSAAGRVVVVGVVLVVVLVAVPNRGGIRARAGVGVLAAVLLLAGGVGLVVDRVQAARDQARVDQQAGDYSRAQLLPQSPGRVVRGLVVAVARDDPVVCSWFAPSAAAAFAAANAAPDCAGAVHRLHAGVRDPVRYESPDRDAVTESVSLDGQSGTADGCLLRWTSPFAPGTGDAGSVPGPAALGVLDGARQLDAGYLVVGYRACR